MNRRNFLTKLGIGAAACAVAPSVIKEEEEQVDTIAKRSGSGYIINANEIPSNMSIEEVMRIWREYGILIFKA